MDCLLQSFGIMLKENYSDTKPVLLNALKNINNIISTLGDCDSHTLPYTLFGRKETFVDSNTLQNDPYVYDLLPWEKEMSAEQASEEISSWVL